MSAEHTCNECETPQRACVACIEEHNSKKPPLWHQARKLASTAFNLLPMPVQLQNFTREERERYVDAMGDIIYAELENAKLHGIRLAALEVHKLPPQEHNEKGQRDYHWEVKRKVWLAMRDAITALLP